MPMRRRSAVVVAVVWASLLGARAMGAQWTYQAFSQALPKFEQRRGAFLPEEQAIRAARIFPGVTDAEIQALVAIQRPKNQMPRIFGPTRAVTPAEAASSPAGSWARVICEAALGQRTTPPGGQAQGAPARPAQLTYDAFLKEKKKFEQLRGAVLPVEQCLRAARCFAGWSQDKLHTLRIEQGSLTNRFFGMGRAAAVTRAECARYRPGTWPRAICEAALGLRPAMPAGIPAPESAPKLWPKSPSWVKDALSKKVKPKIEPPVAAPPANEAVYYMICAQRTYLYWFTRRGQFARLTARPLFRSPSAMCRGPNGTIIVADMPTLKGDDAILWSLDPRGAAQVMNRLDSKAQDEIPFGRPDQILWRQGRLYIAGASRGILVRQPNGRIETAVRVPFPKQERWRVFFGGVAFDRLGRLLFAHSHAFSAVQQSIMPPSFQRKTRPGYVLAADPATGQISIVATDQAAGLFDPRALAITPNGDIYVTDHGVKAGENACLQVVRGNQIVPLRIMIGNRGLRSPCGMKVDRDGSLIIADRFMWNPQGQSGAVIRYVPGGQATYLFQGRGHYNPIDVVPR